MKRIKRHIITIIFPAVFVFLATVPTGIGFETEVQAAGRSGRQRDHRRRTLSADGFKFRVNGIRRAGPGFHSVGSLCEK